MHWCLHEAFVAAGKFVRKVDYRLARFVESLSCVDCDNTVGLTRVDIVIPRTCRECDLLAGLHIPSHW
jgi:hypothetical protein